MARVSELTLRPIAAAHFKFVIVPSRLCQKRVFSLIPVSVQGILRIYNNFFPFKFFGKFAIGQL